MSRKKLSGDEAVRLAGAVDGLVSMAISELEEVSPPVPDMTSAQGKTAGNLAGVKSQLAQKHFLSPKEMKPETLSSGAELLLPSVWAFNKRALKGEPMRFMPKVITKQNLNRVRPFLEQPLNDDAQEKGERKARQLGLSENALTELFWFADVNPHTKAFYTFPTNRQMQDFSNTRIQEAIDGSPYLQQVMGNIKNVNLKQIGTSFLFLRGAQSERLGEGVDADIAFFDEIDRMSPRVKVAFKESLQSSMHGKIREISTPTVPNYGIDIGWQKSKQWNWFIKCSKCNARQTLEWLPDDDFGGRVSVVERDDTHLYACRNCERELSLEDRIHGEWVAKYPKREPSYYQFNQLMAAWISAQKLFDKQEDYPFKQLFFNYVLGVPYLGDNILVTEKQILDGRSLQSRTAWIGPKAMGIDWGDKSWIVIVQAISDERIGLVHLERILSSDVGEIITQVKSVMKRFNPEIMVNDAGYGKDRNTLLLKAFPDRVYSCFYPNSEKGSRIFEPQWQDEQHKVSIDRTTSLKLSLGTFKATQVQMCKEVSYEMDVELKTFVKHLTNLVSVKDFDDKTGEIDEFIANTGADHYGHAYNYAVTALSKISRLPKGEFWDWGAEVTKMRRDGTIPKDPMARSKILVPGMSSTQEILELSGGMQHVRPDKAGCYAAKYNYDPAVCNECSLRRSCRNICDAVADPIGEL
jgi:hypothetical protein